MIAEAQVIVRLTPWLGGALCRLAEEEIGRIAHWLGAWSTRQDLAELSGKIDSLLFNTVHRITRGQMQVCLDDGSWVRVRLEDFSAMADDVMDLLISGFPVDPAHLLILREYSLQHASLSALKALALRFTPLETQQEVDAICAFIRKCYPPFRWRDWLPAS